MHRYDLMKMVTLSELVERLLIKTFAPLYRITIKKEKAMKRNVFSIMIATLMALSLVSCNSNKQEIPDSVTVSGIGMTQAQPDVARINVSSTHTAPTTREAKKAVEQTMTQILKILQEEKVEGKDIKTLALDYWVEYDYINGRRVRVGQRADQTIAVTVHNLINAPERLVSILDKIVSLKNVEVRDIDFDIEDKTDLFKQSRELAYQKAFEKAQQYAKLSGRKLGQVLTMSEKSSEDVEQKPRLVNIAAVREAEKSSPDSFFLPTGEQCVTSEISVVFSLK